MDKGRPLNLVWRRTILDGVSEAQFFSHTLLARLKRPLRWIAVEDQAALPEMDDLLICSFGDCGSYLRELRASGRRNLGVLHLGDELGQDNIEFYTDADYVLRHYYRPGILCQGGLGHDVAWVPNGWARGVGPFAAEHHLPFEEREHEFFFAGYKGGEGMQLPDRQAMLEALTMLGRPATVILTEGFGQGLGAMAYAGYLGNSKFALAPAGNAPETIRFYDALERGAVPVVTDGEWLHAEDGIATLGSPPVVILKDWNQLNKVEGAAYNEVLRGDVVEWWTRLKDHLSARVCEIIETSFAV